LHLPYPAVAVFFGSEFEVPDDLCGGETALDDKIRHPVTLEQVLAGATPPACQGPAHIRFGTLAARRRQPLAIVGVVLTAGVDGTLGDLALFLLSKPSPGRHVFSAVEGLLSRSRLGPLAQNLAAAVAWGDWQAPETGLALPPDMTSGAFRDAIARGAFRRQEPRGIFGAVRVLDARRMYERRAQGRPAEGEGTSPVTHLRRGHWQRYRLGPRDDWHYEPRWIPPVVVNPGVSSGGRVTVYRLPTPPATPT
jgi:hypothetical protein